MELWSVNHDLQTRAKETLSPEDRQKFLEIPYYLHLWTQDHGGLNGKKVLDFGCGGGTSAAGISLLHGATVHGTDINAEADQCPAFLESKFGLAKPGSLTFQEIKPGGEIEGNDYDCIFSWSVFEHVNNRLYASILSDLFSRLKPGGLFFVQISPLYLSPEGSHLWALGYGKWEHLTNQISDTYSDIHNSSMSPEDKRGLWSMFETLNRITADDLIGRFKAAGFELLREQRDDTDKEPPAELLHTYNRNALINYQIVALFQRPLET